MSSYSYAYNFQLVHRKTNKKAQPLFPQQQEPVCMIYQYEDSPNYYVSLWWEYSKDKNVLIGKYNQDDNTMDVHMDKSFRTVLTKYMKEEIVKEMLNEMYNGLEEFEQRALKNGEKVLLDSNKSYSFIIQDYMEKKITKQEMKKRYYLIEEFEKHWRMGKQIVA